MNMYRPIEILIADDHEIFRDGFNLMFKKNPEIRVIGEAANGKELLTMAHRLKPDIIIADIQMPVMDGIQAVRLLTIELPHIGIIALSMYNEETQIVEMLEAGARGYLLKNAHKTEIIAAIKAVNKDENYYCKHTTQKLVKLIAGSNFTSAGLQRQPEFSEKEISIIRLICQEYSNKEIADYLGLSKRTVEWHRDIISEKIHAKNTAGIVVYAIRHKIFKYPK
jgi:DNA-binding NarL/FixJ family response regulator